MPIEPDTTDRETRISMIENMPRDHIVVKVTGREEFDFSSHTHNRHQIIYLLSGTLHIRTEEANYFVTDHQLVWIPRGVPHKLSSNNRQIALLTCYFCNDTAPDYALSVYRTDEMIARNLMFISSFELISRQHTPGVYAFSESFFRLLPDICRPASLISQPFVLTQDRRLAPVLEYIKENMARDITIEDVASHFGFSVRNLTRLFTNSGIRFVHYLNYQRVVRAIEILTDNVMNIEQTAYEVGFNSPNSFSRVFKQITGEPPSVYCRK